IRINTYTVPTYQTRAERQKVPFCTGSFQHFERINTQTIEYFTQLIYEGNIDITLAILNYFSRFRYFNTWSFMCTCYYYFTINSIYHISNFRGTSRSYLHDFGNRVLFISWVNPFR